MKHIRKGEEPKELTQWKEAQNSIGVNCDFRSLQNPEKGIVHYSLLREQGYICCYCCRKIYENSSHLEHLAPQSQTDSELSVDYSNLLTSCGRDPNWPNHCGNKKGDMSLEVSPLQEDCEDFFRYSGEGEILPTLSPDKQDTAATAIEVLGLNDDDLKRMRFEALVVLEEINEDDAQILAEVYRNLDENGHYQPFCVVVLYFLREYFGV